MGDDDDNNNNSSRFVPYTCRDPFVSPLLDNFFIEPDPALVYLLPEPNLQNDEQQSLQGGHVSSTGSTIQDQSQQHFCNDNFTIGGGGVPNYQVAGSSKNKRTYPFTDVDIEHQSFRYDLKAGPSNLNQSESGIMGSRNWPPIPRPFFCTCCQVLRQTIHTNGIIISFTNGTPAEVKGFLEDYIAQKDKLGYIIVEEAFSAFYEALCTKLDWIGKRTNNEDDDLIPPNLEEEEPEAEPEKRRHKRSRKDQVILFVLLFLKSDRINNMTLNDLSGVFHITMKAAKDVLEMSVTLQPLARRLKVLKRALESSQDPVIIQTTNMEVRRIKQEMTQLCGGVTPTGIEIPEVEENSV
ncbi:hypothetical protein glysoja_035276 [Glycine soja]|uniref:Uncharacterized protein n=1 Tax=Glycine soja TaxID=3848 RepID=A0A0B2RJQ9_GLYSO|nr:hypothetical protein glysoja_035276 [Glycine soja]